MARSLQDGHDARVHAEADVEISVEGWTSECRDDLAFLLGQAGVDYRQRDDAVLVPRDVEQQARRLVDYLRPAGDAEPGPRSDAGLVYPLFEASQNVTITDASPADLFSFCFSSVGTPRAPATLGGLTSVEHDVNGRLKAKGRFQTRAGPLEWVFEEINRVPCARLVAHVTDSWNQIWRETWAFEASGPDTVVSLSLEVEVADAAGAPDWMRSLRSDWSAQRRAAMRLGSIKTRYEVG